MTPRQARTLVLAIAITALVAAVPATKILSDRHALAHQKAKVSAACGVPVTIIWDPVADTTPTAGPSAAPPQLIEPP